MSTRLPSEPANAPLDFDLQAFFPYQMNVLAASISRQLAEVYRHRHGLSIAEWRVLAHLSQEDRVSIRELHARIDVDKPKASRACQRLEDRGLIRKRENPADRRLVALGLTAKGRRLMAEIAAEATAFEAELLSALTPEQRVALDGAFAALRRQLSNMAVSAKVA